MAFFSEITTLIKSFFVLTYSLFFFPADCSKEEHWDERYYVEKVPYYGRVVRPCPPGTVFSKSYCDCIVNINGLIPILPGGELLY
jgi:hypothetical protein